MKKIFNFILITLMIFILTACSNSAKPETAVSEFVESAKLFDLNGMAAVVNPSNTIDKDKINDLEGTDENSIEKYFLDYLKSNAKKINYDIKEVKIDGDNAVVTVNFKYINGGPLLKATIGDVFTQAMSIAFSGVEMTDEETSQMFIASLKKQNENIPESFSEKTIDIDCIKVDNKWYIDEPNEELLNVIMSNFITVVDELNEGFSQNSDVEEEESDVAIEEEEYVHIIKNIGEEIAFATIKLKVNSVEEKNSISSSYSSADATEGAKFAVIELEVTNTTNNTFTFPSDIPLVDDKGREFYPYEDSIGNIDNYIDYRELAPSIKEKGCLVYELPNDSNNYSIFLLKDGTDELYEIIIK